MELHKEGLPQQNLDLAGAPRVMNIQENSLPELGSNHPFSIYLEGNSFQDISSFQQVFATQVAKVLIGEAGNSDRLIMFICSKGLVWSPNAINDIFMEIALGADRQSSHLEVAYNGDFRSNREDQRRIKAYGPTPEIRRRLLQFLITNAGQDLSNIPTYIYNVEDASTAIAPLRDILRTHPDFN